LRAYIFTSLEPLVLTPSKLFRCGFNLGVSLSVKSISNLTAKG
jgi:hypothetical protein